MPRLGFRPMKYMGHKGKMLPFLWEILSQRLEGVNAFADPFCGSGAVSWYLATRAPIKVVAGDLQLYAAIRSAAVVERTEIVKDSEIKIEQWFGRAKYELEEVVNLFPWGMKGFLQTTDNQTEMIAYVKRCRNFCSEVFDIFVHIIARQFKKVCQIFCINNFVTVINKVIKHFLFSIC